MATFYLETYSNKLIIRPLILTCNTFLRSIQKFRLLVSVSLILKIPYRLTTNFCAETEEYKRKDT